MKLSLIMINFLFHKTVKLSKGPKFVVVSKNLMSTFSGIHHFQIKIKIIFKSFAKIGRPIEYFFVTFKKASFEVRHPELPI